MNKFLSVAYGLNQCGLVWQLVEPLIEARAQVFARHQAVGFNGRAHAHRRRRSHTEQDLLYETGRLQKNEHPDPPTLVGLVIQELQKVSRWKGAMCQSFVFVGRR